MNREKHEKRNFLLLLALAVIAGLGFLVWGQYNTASTIYDLGFLGRNVGELLASAQGYSLTEEEQGEYDGLVQAAEAWAEGKTASYGRYSTDTAAGWFGQPSRLDLSYTLYTQASDRTVILLHGFRESVADARIWASWWWEQGWDVLIPEMRGDGAEGMVPCTYGVYEQFDLYDLILAAGLQERTLAVQGRGTGAAAAVLLAANPELSAAGLDGVIGESLYARMGDLERSKVKSLFGLGDRFVGVFLRYQIKQRLGFDPDSVDLRAAAAASSVPALFLCAGDDGFLDPADTRAVAEAWGGSRDLRELPEGGHRLLWSRSGEAYRAALEDFAGGLAG
jgi:pimeloyl-ACP methyl ester carboxylesterase